jgi:peptidoglycan/xylan/chitin deacetylase (PgdA/CDA1 family)
MQFSGALAAVLAAALCIASPAQARDLQLAWFKSGNITRSGLQGTHTVALTFDDGPNANTRKVLDVLHTYNVPATFFVVGSMARSHPGTLRRIAAEGHLLANHSATHDRLGARYVRKPVRLIDDLLDVHVLIAPLMKRGDPWFFRAPYGYWKKPHSVALNADPVLRHYAGPIYWDVGGNTEVTADGYVVSAADWDCWPRGWSAETCAKGYLREIVRKDGGVVLMHCIHARAADLVQAIVPELQAKGFNFIRLDEVPGYDYYKGPPPEPKPAVAMAGARHAIGR